MTPKQLQQKREAREVKRRSERRGALDARYNADDATRARRIRKQVKRGFPVDIATRLVDSNFPL